MRPAAPGQAPWSLRTSASGGGTSSFVPLPTILGPSVLREGAAVRRVQTMAVLSVTSPTLTPVAWCGSGDAAAPSARDARAALSTASAAPVARNSRRERSESGLRRERMRVLVSLGRSQPHPPTPSPKREGEPEPSGSPSLLGE